MKIEVAPAKTGLMSECFKIMEIGLINYSYRLKTFLLFMKIQKINVYKMDVVPIEDCQ